MDCPHIDQHRRVHLVKSKEKQGPEYFTMIIVIALTIESKKSLIIKSLKNYKYVLATL